MDTSNGAPGANTTPDDDAARRVKEAAASVTDTAKAALDTAKAAAGERLEQSAENIADRAQTAASTLRRAADDVSSDQAWIGMALRKSADGLEAATQSLSGGDLRRAMDDLNGFARRQPAVFLGASFALGFALSRVGKTAIERATDASEPDGATPSYPSGRYRTSAPVL